MPVESVQVSCHSSHSYPQEPRAFTWRGQRYSVMVMRRAWRTPGGPHFRVQTPDGALVELAYDEAADRWWLCARDDALPGKQTEIDEEVNRNA